MATEKRTVKEIRREKGISLQDLAKATGIPVRTMQLIDQRHYLASPEQSRRIAEALGVSEDALDIGLPKTHPGTWGTGGTYA